MLLDCGVRSAFGRVLGAIPLVATALLALACRPDPPLPPDPEEPTPESTCADHPALSLTRITADSSIIEPPWVQVCAQCPVAEIDVGLGDGAGGSLDVESLWTPDRACVVSMPTSPLPARPSVPAVVTVRDSDNTGTFEFDLPISGDRGPDPVDLGTATYVLPLDEDTSRILGGPALFESPPEALALHLGAADAEGRRVLTLGAARDGGARQDLCVPTASWTAPASLLQRQVAAPIGQDDLLPFGLLARRGALQGRLTPGGDALEDVTLLSLADVGASEVLLGAPPAEACATWADRVGFDPCVPCGPPSDGVAGLPGCVPFVFEWVRAERAEWALASVDPDDIPLGCRFPSGGDDDDSAGR